MSDPESVEEIFPGVYRLPDPKNPSKKLVATRNLTPGKTYYGERSAKINFLGQNTEFRLWDPFRSKLSAAILNGLEVMPFREGTTCLYLGASTGTTVSHVSDLVGQKGKIFAVEVASRVAREFLENVVKYRANIVPIIADARQPEKYSSVYGEISTVYCDIAQPDQTEIAMTNCMRFLDPAKGGTLCLVVKASSIDALKDKRQVFDEQLELLKKSNFDLLQKIDLEPYDRNHAMIISKMRR
ncbi:MAG: fibrillarin-like rRNA/tRNA 2'-O-methyltransferase [Nitrososphaerales archaeon]